MLLGVIAFNSIACAGETTLLYCNTHQLDNMFNLNIHTHLKGSKKGQGTIPYKVCDDDESSRMT